MPSKCLISQPSTKRTKLQPPTLLEPNSVALCLGSTLASLSLYKFQVEASHLCRDLAQVFERYPLLPGAVISDRQSFLGIVSRQRLMEFMVRGQTASLPMSALYSYTHINSLVLPVSTPILPLAPLDRTIRLKSLCDKNLSHFKTKLSKSRNQRGFRAFSYPTEPVPYL